MEPKEHISRRSFLKIAGVALPALVLGACSAEQKPTPAVMQKNVELGMIYNPDNGLVLAIVDASLNDNNRVFVDSDKKAVGVSCEDGTAERIVLDPNSPLSIRSETHVPRRKNPVTNREELNLPDNISLSTSDIVLCKKDLQARTQFLQEGVERLINMRKPFNGNA